ncbi:MAG TPA: carboxymuconolactone decarboxylase family protein [Pseudogracilibacillus sp.]|nr:carboxymuconolactone decarboxylase family protein [Pseudogracilibacillus sp.]
MTEDRYQKGWDKIMELTSPDENHPTGHMDIGEGFKDIAPDLEKYVVEFAFGDIYARPGIDNKQKVLTTISGLVAQGTPQIEMHIKTGLQVGLTPDEMVGSIVHLLPYVGFPRVLNALKAAQAVFNEAGVSVTKKQG